MNTIKTNFHTHSQRCGHADGIEEDYIKSAISCGVSELGFSDHGPYPDFDFGLRMPFCELPKYLEALDALIPKYQKEITIKKGLEIEYLPKYRDYYEDLLTKWGIEYLLMGEHFYLNAQGEETNIYGSASTTSQFIAYAQTIAEGMKTGLFKAVAHPDLYMLNSFAWDDNCKKAADIIIDTAAATDTILEYNANGLRRGLKPFPDGIRYPYPHDAFWAMAAQAPIKVFVSSDCHNPKDVWDDSVELAYEKLQSIGIQPVMHIL